MKITKRGQYICAITLLISALASTDVFAQQRPTGVMCDGYARNYAEQASKGKMAGKIFVDTLIGLGIGAATGGAGLGAAIGAGVGTIGGGVIKSKDYDKAYRIAYQDCMAGRVR